MRAWPVPDSFHKFVPSSGQPGSFWEYRGDRHHAGVDIYAPAGAPVLACEGGVVHSICLFTSPAVNTYWNPTLCVTIKTASGIYHRYAELAESHIPEGAIVTAGQLIGRVGSVLKPEGLSPQSPVYIRRQVAANYLSMLHFEMLESPECTRQVYSGGNFFIDTIPAGLLDPTPFLNSISTTSI